MASQSLPNHPPWAELPAEKDTRAAAELLFSLLSHVSESNTRRKSFALAVLAEIDALIGLEAV